MTKTLKKGLIAVLMFIMAVVLGVAAYTSLSVARAEERPDYVGQFETYMKDFIDWAKDKSEDDYLEYLTDEHLLVKSESTQSLWTTYGSAKKLYSNNMTNAERNNVSSECKAVWTALENVFSTIYGYASRVNAVMDQVAEVKYYSQRVNGVKAIDLLKALEADIGELKNYEDVSATPYLEYEDLLSEGQYAYLQYITDNFDFMARAKRNLDRIWKNIQDTNDAINAIAYYDVSTKMMRRGRYEGVRTQRIVLDSEESLKKVEAALALVHENDYEFIEKLDKYNAAVKMLAKQYEIAKEVDDMIQAVYDKVEQGKTYYTLKAEIEAARKAYDDLANDRNAAWKNGLKGPAATNHNDLQSLVENLNLLIEMEGKIKELEEKIKKVEEAIDAIPNEGDDNYEYCDEFEEAVKKAEQLFDELDEDIKKHDEDLYDKLHDPDYDPETDPNPDDEYIVPNYEDMRDARDQYDEWGRIVDELLDWVDELIRIDALQEGEDGFETKGRDLVDQYNKINDIYHDDHSIDDGGELTPNQLKKFDETEKEFRGSTETVREVLKKIRNTIDSKLAQVGPIDGQIHNLYVESLESCIHDSALLTELLEIKAAYDKLDSDVKTYLTYTNELSLMWAEYLAENALIEAWIEAVKGIKLHSAEEVLADAACVLTWDTIDAAETAWLALVHMRATEADDDVLLLTTDANLEAVSELATFENEELPEEDLGMLQQIVAELYKTEYAAYTAAVASRDKLAAQIKKVVDAMAALDTDPQPINEVPEWIRQVKSVMQQVEDLLGLDEHALVWIEENNQEAYENYEKAVDMIPPYEVEAKIDGLYEGNAEEAEGQIGLKDAGAIDEAREKLNDYLYEKDEDGSYKTDEDGNKILKEGRTEDDIRNTDKLEAAEAALAKLTEELNAWMIRVIRLYNPEFSAESTREEILAEIKNAAKFIGYPLNISEDAEKYPEDGLAAVRAAYAELVKADSAEAEYVAAAWDLVNPAGTNTLEYSSSKAISDLNDDIKLINSKYYDEDEKLNGKVPDGDDLKLIESINQRLNDFHASQLEQINERELKKFEDLLDSIDVPAEFYTMIEELYNEAVINGNVTSYTPYYLEILKTIYKEFNPAVQAMFTVTIGEGEEAKTLTFEEVVSDIEQAIADARDEEGNLPSLKGAFASIDELKEAINGQLAELQATISELEEKFGELEGVTEALETLKSQYAELKSALDVLTGRVDELENWKDQVDEKLAALGDGSLADKLGELTEQLTQDILDSVMEALDKAMSDAFAMDLANDLAAKFAEFRATVNSDIQNAIEELKEELQEQFDALQSQIDELEEQMGELASKSDLEDTKKALEEAKKDLSDKLAALTGRLDKVEGDLSDLTEELGNVAADLAQAKKDIQKVQDDYLAAIEKAVGDLKKELEGQLKELTEQLEKLEADSATKKELEAAQKDLNDKLTAIDGRLAKVEGEIPNLKSGLSDLNKALEGVKEDLKKAKDEITAAYEKAIKDAIAELEGKLNERLGKLDSSVAGLESSKASKEELTQAQADLQKKIDELKKTIGDIEGGKSVADALKELNTAVEKAANDLKDAEKRITEAYKKYVDDAVAAARKDLEGKIGELDSKLQSAQSVLNDLIVEEKNAREAGDAKLAKDLQDAIKALQGEIASAKTDLQGEIDAAKAELQKVIDALNVEDINGLVDELTKANQALASTKSDLESKIAAAKTDLEGKIAAAKTELEAAIKALEAKMEAADAKLQEQLDALNSKTSTMLILIIVLAVVLVAAVVCIILLFLKRNKANA